MPTRFAGTGVRILAAAALVFHSVSCGPTEEEILLQQFEQDLSIANSTIDSLNYSVESSNMLIDEMRARVDSLQRVDAKLLESVQKLNGEVKKWRNLTSEHRRKNEQLTTEIERMKRDKQADQRTIARLRAESDSLTNALLESHTNIRRREDHLRQMEVDLAQAKDTAAQLQAAETSVRVLVASERFLKENGYLKSSRTFGRAFRKSHKLVSKLDPVDPRVQLVPIGDTVSLDGKLQALVDRYGSLEEGEAYRKSKGDGGVEITFVDAMLGGVDVLAVMKD